MRRFSGWMDKHLAHSRVAKDRFLGENKSLIVLLLFCYGASLFRNLLEESVSSSLKYGKKMPNVTFNAGCLLWAWTKDMILKL